MEILFDQQPDNKKIKKVKKGSKILVIILAVFALMTFIYGCIEPFSPPEVNSDERYLVVDGFLNVGNDTSKIELRHSQNTNETAAMIAETGAKLSVSGEKGEKYDFVETKNGMYILPPVNVSLSGKYHLSIKTRDGKEYVSEDVPVVVTPAIDSVTYNYDQDRDAMVIKVNTHDPTNKARFYKWKFEETYQYRTAYYSGLEVDLIKKEIVSRKEDISMCYQTVSSTNIMLGSTIKLSSDEIRQLPLNIVEIGTNKFYIKYSILVKQYGLSRAGFEYWTDLAKTTQGTGSLFDPLPSQVTGNIKSTTNPKELIFGFFSASTVATKRIFISPGLGTYPRCVAPDTILVSDAIKNPSGLLISYAPEQPNKVLQTSGYCADCRTQGGTIVKPSFWK